MSGWEERIIAAFIEHYFASAPKTGEEKRAVLRLRHAVYFPRFDAAMPDEKESYLEAAETLERKGLVKINWEKRSKGERIKTISCTDFEKLFAESGAAYPQSESEKIRALFKDHAKKFRALTTDNAQMTSAFLDYLAVNFGPREIAQGIKQKAAEDFIRLMETFLDPAKREKISTRALSILLYRDSKRLETILALFNPLVSRAQKEHIPAPSLSFLERSYPMTLVSGSIILEYKEGGKPPLVNASGLILGIPLESVEVIGSIKTIAAKERPSALIIENEETFYALGSPRKLGVELSLSQNPVSFGEGSQKSGLKPDFSNKIKVAFPKIEVLGKPQLLYDCFLYSGGYRNRPAAAFIRLLSASRFCLHHAGDLDPDGILILQNIRDTAEQPVMPVMMNAAVFDRYLPWSRPLGKGALRQLTKIRDDTRAIPGIAELIRLIEETARGVEQEIIDYRGSVHKVTDFMDRH
jgi:hypothetical protein